MDKWNYKQLGSGVIGNTSAFEAEKSRFDP